jgi:plastocyanin
MSFILAAGLLHPLPAGEIRGVITVKRKLTKRVAAPSLDTYERGVAVPIAVEEEDPLVYERTHTVVYLEGELPAAALVTKKMQQENRVFGPDLVVLPAGSSVSFPNMDPIFHNVFSLSKAKSFDLGNYSKGQTRTVTFPKPGIVLVNCRLHTNMSAVVVVTPNRFYASPDEKGRFAIPDVPPGRYTVTAWHKAAGFLRKDITVADGEPSSVDFLVPLSGPDNPGLSVARR